MSGKDVLNNSKDHHLLLVIIKPELVKNPDTRLSIGLGQISQFGIIMTSYTNQSSGSVGNLVRSGFGPFECLPTQCCGI